MMAVGGMVHDLTKRLVSGSQHDIYDSQRDPLEMENRLCPGCKLSVVDENGGLVVAFGQSFFHVDCFKCAKCSNQVTADTNLLLLSDGSPICANCSYSCNVCGLPILDEAIMTGDDSYHAHCFKCKICSNRIDELVFAKTSQGIYCMNCHNERMAKIRRHAQKKREREEKEKAMGSGSSRSRDRAANESHRDNGTPSSVPGSGTGTASSANTLSSAALSSAGSPYIVEPPSTAATSPYSVKRASVSPPGTQTPGVSLHPSDYPQQQERQVSGSSTMSSDQSYRESPRRPAQTNLPPTPEVGLSVPIVESSSSSSLEYLRSSPRQDGDAQGLSVDGPSHRADDGIGLVNAPPKLRSESSSLSPHGQSLLSPSPGMSRAEKRRSINPGLVINPPIEPPANLSSVAVTPSQSQIRSQTSPVQGGRSSPRSSPSYGSPRREHFPGTESRPNSGDSLHAYYSPRSQASSPSGGPPPPPYGPEDAQRSRTLSSNTYFARSEHEQRNVPSPLRPPLRSSNTLERVPARLDSLPEQGGATRQNSTDSFSTDQRTNTPDRLSPGFPEHRSRLERDDRPSTSSALPDSGRARHELMRPLARSTSRSRPSPPASPMHHVDVPQGVESGTDTDVEADSGIGKSVDSHGDDFGLPPAPPPKEIKAKPRPQELMLNLGESIEEGTSPETSAQPSAMEDEESEGSPGSAVHRTSVATFIAPALPPIRFSLTSADFSDLLRTVNGGSSGLKPLEQLLKVNEEGSSPNSPTQPPSAHSFSTAGRPSTPASDTVSLGTVETEATLNDSTKDTDKTVVLADHHQPVASSIVRSKTEGSPPSETSPGAVDRSSVATLRRTGTKSKPPTTARQGSLDGNIHRPVAHINNIDEPPEQDSRIRTLSDSNALAIRSKESLRRHGRQLSDAAISNGIPDSPLSMSPPAAPRISVSGTSVISGTSVSSIPANDLTETVVSRLKEALGDAATRQAQHLKLDKGFVEVMLQVIEQQKQDYTKTKGKLDTFKRTSQQYMDGLTVAQTEYDAELKARRDAEAEVMRLRVLLSGQAARLSAMSGETKRQEVRQRLSQRISDDLEGLERDLSKLKVERDLTLAEVEGFSASRCGSSAEQIHGSLSRSLTSRLDKIKVQYKHELVPLKEQRETLTREIAELRAVRDAFLEETTTLNARNEELARLGAQYARKVEHAEPPMTPLPSANTPVSAPTPPAATPSRDQQIRPKLSGSFDSLRRGQTAAFHAMNGSGSYDEKAQKQDVAETPNSKPQKILKWPGSKPREPMATIAVTDNRVKSRVEHTFHQLSILRFARCDHCGDKMWGSQLRCNGCSISVHSRCINLVNPSCLQTQVAPDEHNGRIVPLPPSMFGRLLVEQAAADANGTDRLVPVIVEKCIDAVDLHALDYEGIYRKTGGSGQTKIITQLFEQGDYNAFDLRDSDRFNDICSVTSVLKNYFRSLPDPLLTYDLHDDFMMASEIKDSALKNSTLQEVVNRLPPEHYHTCKVFMLHLRRVREHSQRNLMNSRNLGVVFGPTLMRSRDPSAEFSDMAGKALTIEWLIENAHIFAS